jgi:hypothetical protein
VGWNSTGPPEGAFFFTFTFFFFALGRALARPSSSSSSSSALLLLPALFWEEVPAPLVAEEGFGRDPEVERGFGFGPAPVED